MVTDKHTHSLAGWRLGVGGGGGGGRRRLNVLFLIIKKRGGRGEKIHYMYANLSSLHTRALISLSLALQLPRAYSKQRI